MRTFEVEVWWDGQVVAGVTEVTPLRDTTAVVTYREGGGGIYKIPGSLDVAGVTISRGVSEDLTFDLWGKGPLLKKDVELRLFDGSDGLRVGYRLHRCWVSGYAVVPDLASGTVVESLSLSVDYWERVTLPVSQLADQIAKERSSQVIRVPLGSLMTGYTDEIMKRLDSMLADAEKSGAILLLDEADALFARRTEVQDSHERYQPTELDQVLDRVSSSSAQVLVVPPDDPERERS